MVRSLLCSAVLATLVASPALSDGGDMQIGDAALAYVDEGEGTPVLFVHGAISDLRAWEPYRESIAKDWRFVAYTQRYFGTKPWQDDAENFQRATHVEDLIAFIEALDAGPVHLMTWSYSGEIGIHAMMRRPDLFRSAVHYEPVLDRLVDGAPGGSNATRTLFSSFGPAVEAAQSGRGEDAALRFIEAVFDLPNGGAAGEAGETMWRENGRTVLPYISMEPPLNIDCAEIGNIDTPMLILQGADSFTRFSIMAERVASCAANAMVVTVADANHDGPYRHPATVRNKITGFLSTVE